MRKKPSQIFVIGAGIFFALFLFIGISRFAFGAALTDIHFLGGAPYQLISDGAGTFNIVTTSTTGGAINISSRALTSGLFLDTSNNVGIGTSTPASQLHVVGTSTVTGDLVVTGGINGTFTGTNSGATLASGVRGNGSVFGSSYDSWGTNYRFNDATNTALLYIDATNKRVGVGTASPANKLDVIGGSIYLSNASVDGGMNDGYASLIIKSHNTQTIPLSLGIAGYQGPAYLKMPTGSPAFQLQDSSGNAKLVMTSAGNVGIGTSTPGSVVYIKNDINPTLTIDTGAGGTVNDVAQIKLKSYTVEPAVISFGYQENTLAIQSGRNNSAGISLQTLTGGTPQTRMTITNAGNVGIGTSTPAEKLTVAGNIKLDVGASATNYIRTAAGQDLIFEFGLSGSSGLGVRTIKYSVAGGGYARVDYGGAGTYQYDVYGSVWHMGYAGLSFTNSGGGGGVYPMTLTSANGIVLAGNVSVGTTASTTAKLVISPGAQPSIDAGSQRIINVAVPTSNNDAANKTYVDSAISAASSTNTGVWSVNGANIYNSNAGNVGVGTTTPTQDNLQVNGTFSAQARSMFVDNLGNISATSFVDRASPAYFLQPSATTTSMKVAGNVGIGMAGTPAASLHVLNAGTDALVTRISGGGSTNIDFLNVSGIGNGITMVVNRISGGTDASGAAVDLRNTYGNSNYAGINVGTSNINFTTPSATIGTNRMTILGSSGNVGIGTSTPTAKLSIVGASGKRILLDPDAVGGWTGIWLGGTATQTISNYNILGDGTSTLINRPSGGTIEFREGNNTQMTIASGGAIAFGNNPQFKSSNGGFTFTNSTAGTQSGKQIINLVRTMPTVIDSTVDIGTFGTQYSHSLRATISVNDSAFSVAKSYIITSEYGQTGGVWLIIPPISDGGIYSGNDYQLEAMQTGPAFSLRLRRTAGANVGTARITLDYDGDLATSFVPSTLTSSSVPIATIPYPTTVITQRGSNVGLATLAPTTARLVITPGAQPSIDAGSQRIINVAVPTSNNDAANKTYVDSAISAASSSNVGVWSTNGADIYNSNAGNVGVGTTTPTLYKLQVAGTFGASNNLIYTDTLGNISATSFVDQASPAYFLQPSAAVSLKTAGSVGIGMAGTPAYTLQVVGTAQVSSYLRVPQISTNGVSNRLLLDVDSGVSPALLIKNRSSATGDLVGIQNESGAQLVTVSHSGNVGISTTVPAAPLTVGTSLGSGANVDSVSGYSLGILNGNMRIVSTESATNNASSTVINLLVSKPGGWWGGMANIDFEARDRGNVYNLGILARVAGGVADNDTAPNGQLVFSTANNGVLLERMRLDKNGNVGIGTTTPATNLHVIGSSTISGNLEVGGNITGTFTGTNSGATLASSVRGNGAVFGSAFDAGGTNYQFNTSSTTSTALLYIDAGNGRVGVGTAAPATKFNVVEGSAVNGTEIARFMGGSGSHYASFATVGASDYGGAYLGSPYIKSDIGQLFLPATVYVNGTVNNGQSTWTSSGGAGTVLSHGGSTALAGFTIKLGGDATYQGPLMVKSGTGTELVRVATSGNVGIGTTTPSYKLEVNGTLKSGTATVDALVVRRPGANLVTIHSSDNAGNSGVFFQGAGDRGSIYGGGDYNIYIEPNAQYGAGHVIMNSKNGIGNVGIGTSTYPTTAKLVIVPGSSPSIDAGSQRIINLAVPTGANDAANKTYVDSAISAASSSNVGVWSTNGADIYNSNAGNVGVGSSTTPSYKFQVYGSLSSDNGQIFSDGTGNLSAISFIDKASPAYFLQPSAAVSLKTVGSVGIGLAGTPGAKLHIVDNGIATMRLESSSVGGRKFDFGVGTAMFILGDTVNTQIFSIAGGAANNALNITTDGRTIFGYSVRVPNTSAYQALNAAGNANLVMASADANNNYLYADSKLVILNNGNIGVGTTTPAYKLQVDTGGTHAVMGISSNTGLTQGLVFSGGGVPLWNLSSRGTFDGASSNRLGIYNQNAATEVMTFAQNGYIGIGTSTPGVKLDIFSTSDTALRVSAATSPYIAFVQRSNNQQWWLGANLADTSGNFHLYDMTAAAMRFSVIKGTGNVGLSSSTPTSARLVINPGAQPSIDAGSQRIINVGTPTGVNDAANKAYIDSAIAAATSSGVWTTSGTNIYNANSGNVGVGSTTVPAYKFQVFGTMSSDNGQIFSDGAGNLNAISYYDKASPSYFLQPSGTVSLKTAGSVGIGIAGTPVSKLDVSGGISAGSYAGVSASPSNGLIVSGNVGIGTSTPGANALYVNGAALINGTLNMNNNNISSINKLSVAVIDPLYNIGGKNYSTYAASIAGGVKEEFVGRGKLLATPMTNDKCQKSNDSECLDISNSKFVIDLAAEPEGSDLWLWYQAVDFSRDNVEVLATAYGVPTSIAYEINGTQITFRAHESVEFSYRLIGKRHDWKAWPTFAKDQTEKASFTLDEK